MISILAYMAMVFLGIRALVVLVNFLFHHRLPDAELGLGNSIHVQAYRISSLVPGSLSLILADILPWGAVFQKEPR